MSRTGASPPIIEQLRTTEGRTKNVKIEPVPVYSREDVGQVARAFDAVHSEAVRLASEQAALRANVNDMFVNLVPTYAGAGGAAAAADR